MEKQVRIRATAPTRWIVCSVLLMGLLLLAILDVVAMETAAWISTLVGVMLVFSGTLWNLIHARYLTAEGVECCRFGNVIRRISWKQTAQVCAARESKNTSITMLIIIPVGCEAYDAKRWSGREYAFRFRNQVAAIDDTKANRQYIEAHFGQITDKRNS